MTIIGRIRYVLEEGLVRNLAGGDTHAMLGDLYHQYTWYASERAQRKPQQMSGALMEMIESGLTKHATPASVEAHAQLPVLRAELSAFFQGGGWDGFLTPCAVGEATVGRTTGNPTFCTPWSYLGNPSAAVPGCIGENGLPVGVQLCGPQGEDQRVLALAGWLHSMLMLTRPVPPGPPRRQSLLGGRAWSGSGSKL